MRANSDVRKTAIRGIIAGIKNAKVDKQAELTDEDVLGIVRKEIKAQREAISDAEKASRADLVAESEAKIKVLEEFVPKQLGRAEVIERVRAIVTQVGAAGPGDMGKVMKVAQPQLRDIADGKMISDVVKEVLASL